MNKITINKTSDIEAIRATRKTDLYQVAKPNVAKTEEKSPIAEDKLVFSGRAAEVGSLVDQVKQLPDVRADIVGELRLQVSAGEYQPTSDEIAVAIIKDEGKG